jgi:hypothetical protein
MSEPTAQSPFYENTNIQWAWDSTSLGLFKTCPRKYYYSMIEEWAGRGLSVHLIYGQWYHSALELYDKDRAAGKDHEDALRHVVRLLLDWTWVRPTDASDPSIPPEGHPWSMDHNTKTRENLVRTVVWYLEQFRDDPAKTVILDGGVPAVELSFRLDAGDDLVLCGHLDRLVDFGGQKFVMDHKTASTTISNYYFDQYKPSNQMTLYTLAAQIIYKEPVAGVIISAAQIAVGFSRFARGITYRTPAELDEYLRNTRRWVADAHRMGEESVTLPDPAEAFPMNDTSCHDFGGCPFRSVCSVDPGIRPEVLKANYEKREWNPLEVR